MLAEWTAACGPDDPVLVVPWSDSASDARFINLRSDPFDIAEIPEADAFPPLRRALRSLNAANSAFLTAKCDVWTLTQTSAPNADPADLDLLRLDLDLEPEDAAFAQASYIDLLPRERSRFASPHVATDLLARLCRRALRLPHPHAKLELTLRPALADLTTPLEGYAATLYLTALAADPETAARRWEAALEDTVHLLREREWAVPPGSATID